MTPCTSEKAETRLCVANQTDEKKVGSRLEGPSFSWAWVKIIPPEKPQVLVMGSTYQGNPFWGYPIFDPPPVESRYPWVCSRLKDTAGTADRTNRLRGSEIRNPPRGLKYQLPSSMSAVLPGKKKEHGKARLEVSGVPQMDPLVEVSRESKKGRQSLAPSQG